MTAKDFVIKIINLYGDFKSKGMADEFYATVSKYSDSQRDSLYQMYIKKIPGNYTPDLRSLLECIDCLSLKVEKPTKVCVCCGWNIGFNTDVCEHCGYSPEYNLAEYKQHLENNREKICNLLANFMVDLRNKGSKGV